MRLRFVETGDGVVIDCERVVRWVVAGDAVREVAFLRLGLEIMVSV
jgi:hypothetical protein